MRLLLACSLLVGCAQTLDFNQCSTDADCTSSLGAGTFCTQDHFCVKDPVCKTKIVGTGNGPPLVVASLVNESDPFDQHIEYATVIAVNEINMLQSGANQPPIELHLCDQGTMTSDAQTALQHAVEYYHAVAIIGPTASDPLIAMNSYLVAHQVLAMSPSATSIAITGLSDDDLVWRTAPSDALQGAVLAKLVSTQMNPAPTEVDAIYVDSVYGKGLANTFTTTFDMLMPTPGVDLSRSFPAGGDFTGIIAQFTAKPPSDLLAVADVDAPTLLGYIGAQPALAMTRIYMTDSALTNGLFTPMGQPATPKSVLDRVRLTAPGIPRVPTYDAFRHDYMNASPDHSDPKDWGFDANAYDAMYLVAIAAAARPGGGATGPDIARALKTLNQSGDETDVGPDTYGDAVKKMQGGNLRLLGASGPLDFDPGTGDLRSGAFDVYHVTYDTNGMPNGFAAEPPPM